MRGTACVPPPRSGPCAPYRNKRFRCSVVVRSFAIRGRIHAKKYTHKLPNKLVSGYMYLQRHRGEPGHTGHTRDTRTHEGTRTFGPHRRTSQPSKPTNNTQPARQRDDRSRGRLSMYRYCTSCNAGIHTNDPLSSSAELEKFGEKVRDYTRACLATRGT